jgi:hypothetical protein
MILLYIVYHKRNIKSTVKEELPLYSPGKKVITDEFIYSEEVEKLKKQKEELPLYSPGKKVITDEFIYSEEVEKLKKQKKAYNKKRVLEKK